MRYIILLFFFLPGLLTGQTPDTHRELKLTGNYLNLPVHADGPRQKMSLQLGEELREFDIILAGEKPDFFIPVNVGAHKGETATIDLSAPAPKALAAIYQSDKIPGSDSLYRERLRPQVHFSPRRGWNNDPNGLVYHDGTYHLYFQYNPYGWGHGNMHWGHATSTDLVRWEEQPIAIRPYKYGDWAFSGSAVIDKQNTAGFGKNALVAVYTSTGRGECLKYSLDGGATFEEFTGNPVLQHTGRDPKVFWYEPGGFWVMVVYDESDKTLPDGTKRKPKTLRIYNSDDLKEWTYRSEVGPFWECPELFELPVDGDPNNKKWVLHGASVQYYIGNFDGKVFTPETPRYEFKEGSHYASQTWNNTPDGRRIMIGWGAGIATPGMPFNQLMLFPTELRLETTPDGVRMLPRPKAEISRLHGRQRIIEDTIITRNAPLVVPTGTEALHVKMEFTAGDTWDVGLKVNGYDLKYHVAAWRMNEHFVRPIDDKISVEVIADRTSIEVFVNDGSLYLSGPHRTPSSGPSVEVYATNPEWMPPQQVNLDLLEIHELNSIWR